MGGRGGQGNKSVWRKKTKRAAAWGVFPDMVAFAPGFVWFFWNIAFGGMTIEDLPRPDDVEPASRNTLMIFSVTSMLYNMSHKFSHFLFSKRDCRSDSAPRAVGNGRVASPYSYGHPYAQLPFLSDAVSMAVIGMEV